MNQDVTTLMILDTRFKRKDNNYRVRLRITFKREQRYYSTKFVLTQDEFNKVYSKNPKGDFKELNEKFNEIESRAREVVKNLPDFSFELFEKHFKAPNGKATLTSYYESYIKQLKKEGRAGTVQNYQSSINSLIQFTGKKIIQFKDITPSFLIRYENWMLKEAKTISTVGIYTRPLRAIFNKAISEKAISEVIYPFGKDKYQIPASRNIKKALTIEDIERVYNYPTLPNTPEDKAKDLWFFSYLCNGINIKDICKLKYQNINFNEGEISFVRAKTERTRRQNIKPVVAVITNEIKDIIDKWGNRPRKPETYVFPILTNDLIPEQEFARIRQATKTINKYMKRIGEALGLKLTLTTYTARHSYSTILKKSGVPIEFISESLGHSDLKTTENYLDSFSSDTKKEVVNKLLNFKKD